MEISPTFYNSLTTIRISDNQIGNAKDVNILDAEMRGYAFGPLSAR